MATASAETVDTLKKARLAIQHLANVPQSQRRYIQMGWMKTALENLDNAVADLDTLVAEEAITAEQAEGLREVIGLVHQGLDTHDNFLEFDPEKQSARDFLLSDALETEEWETIRQKARKLFDEIVGEESVFVAIHAK